jgi:cytidine deaminase
MNNAEDNKLVILATNTLARSSAKQAAALRDNTGRTYVAINVATHGLTLDAFEAVLTVALASGITGIESVVAVGEEPANSAVIKGFSPDATIFFINGDGQERAL